MSTDKIQLVEVPEAKNINKQLLAGAFMVSLPVIILMYNGEIYNLDLGTIPGHWAELIFFIGGFLIFYRTFQLKRRQKMYFVEFSEHTLTFRNKNQEQVWIDKSEMEKIEVGEISAIIYLKDGGQKILKFGEAPEDNIPVIKDELKHFL